MQTTWRHIGFGDLILVSDEPCTLATVWSRPTSSGTFRFRAGGLIAERATFEEAKAAAELVAAQQAAGEG